MGKQTFNMVQNQAIEDFCKRHHIKKLALFGSVVKGDDRPDSDLDVLVEFEKGKIPGFAFFRIQSELSELLGRPVDLNTPGFLSRHIREQVISEAKVQYEKQR